jgi:hypothetical protein
MKVTALNNKKPFTPISIQIDLETEQEMNCFYSIFTGRLHRQLSKLGLDVEAVYEAISDANGETPDYNKTNDIINDYIENGGEFPND